MLTDGTWRITFTWPSSYDGKDVPPLMMDCEFCDLQSSIDEVLSTFVGSRIIHVRPAD